MGTAGTGVCHLDSLPPTPQQGTGQEPELVPVLEVGCPGLQTGRLSSPLQGLLSTTPMHSSPM